MAWLALSLGLLAIALAGIVWNQRRQIRDLVERRKGLVMEEHRMFAFLHGLSETLPQTKSQAGLYDYILKGVSKVVGAKSGALYLLDESAQSLVPRAMLPDMPALFPVPNDVERDSSALHSHLMLRSLPFDESTIIGTCLLQRQWTHQNDLWLIPELKAPSGKAPMAGMIAPLYSGEGNIGVLVIVGDSQRFSANDFAVFRSLADQSSLALGMLLLSRQTAAMRQMDRELENARAIQRVLLPASPPALDGFDIAGFNSAARVVSGDYFDYIPLGEGRLGVAVADVSGKGIPASLLMAMGRSVLRTIAPGIDSPTSVLGSVNRHLFPDVRQDLFISMAYAVFQASSPDFTLSRAGHDPPLLYRAASAALEELRPPGLALGIDGGDVFDRVTRDLRVHMDPGDVLLLYTDGLNEAMNTEGEEFGLERVRAEFRNSAKRSAKLILEHLVEQANAFVGKALPSDDMTLVVVKKL